MPISIRAIALSVAVALLAGCSADIDDTGANSNGTAKEAISYGNNDCWYASAYDEYWVDPNNPGSGEHVVIWYHCDDNFATPIMTYATVDVEGIESGWMVWQSGDKTYMVFANGTYWWYRRWVMWDSPSEIIADIDLY